MTSLGVQSLPDFEERMMSAILTADEKADSMNV
jgi:hypothetical protein